MATENECTSVAGHFDGLVETLKRYMKNCPMKHDQGFTGSRWSLPLGDYLLRIAPAAARATINATIVQNVLILLAVLMANAMCRYYTKRIAQWRRFVAFIKATKHHRRASTRFDRHQSDMPTPISGVYFIVNSLKKSSSCPNNNRGETYQTDEKHLNNMSEYFVGVVNIVFNRYNNRFF